MPKGKKTFCKKCKKHAPHKVTQYKTGKASLYAQGAHRRRASRSFQSTAYSRGMCRRGCNASIGRRRAAAGRNWAVGAASCGGQQRCWYSAAALLRGRVMQLRLPCWRPRDMLALLIAGKRRYDRKQSGYGGQTKPVFHKKARCRRRLPAIFILDGTTPTFILTHLLHGPPQPGAVYFYILQYL